MKIKILSMTRVNYPTEPRKKSRPRNYLMMIHCIKWTPLLSCRGFSAPFPIENSHLFFPIKKSIKKKKKFYFFLETTHYLRETMTHIRMIPKHLCLSSMLGIISSKITWFWGYFLLPLLCSMLLISPNFDVKSIIFSQFWQRGLFPKLLEKALSCADPDGDGGITSCYIIWFLINYVHETWITWICRQ